MPSSAHQPHALIIEDELISGLALQLQLADLGFRSFAFAGTERQALEQAQLHCPDLLTVDVGLLDGNGLDAADAIARMCGPVPVVYVTGDPRRVDRPGAQVVVKPISTETLTRAVAAARAAVERPYERAWEGPLPRGLVI